MPANVKNAEKLLSDIQKIQNWNERSSFTLKGIKPSMADLKRWNFTQTHIFALAVHGLMEPRDNRQVLVKYIQLL